MQHTGIKAPCPLNALNNFHVICNRAADIMHDFLEGICPLEVKLMLSKFIQKGCFDLNTLNGRITSYNYGLKDRKNKPCTFASSTFPNPDAVAKQNASQMLCLLRHMPLFYLIWLKKMMSTGN